MTIIYINANREGMSIDDRKRELAQVSKIRQELLDQGHEVELWMTPRYNIRHWSMSSVYFATGALLGAMLVGLWCLFAS